jgi:hypothetical protein
MLKHLKLMKLLDPISKQELEISICANRYFHLIEMSISKKIVWISKKTLSHVLDDEAEL